MAINKKLITFDKKLTFLGANGINNLSSPVDGYYNLIPTWSMVFIKDTGEIWHDGVYFGKPIKDQIAPIMSGTTKGIVFTPNGTDYYYKDFNLWGNTFDGDTKNINGDLVVQGVTYKWTYGDLGIKKGNTNLISFSNSANDYDVFIPNGDLLVTGGDINVNNGKVILDSTGYIKGTHILNTNSYFNADNTLGKTWSSIKQFNTSGTTISLDTTRPAIINIQEHAHASGTLWVPWIAGGDITEQSSWGIGLGGDAFYIGRIAKSHTENSLSEYWKFDSEDGITISGTTKYIKVAGLTGASEKIFMADGTVKAISDLSIVAQINEATTTDYGGFKLTQAKASTQQALVSNTTGNGRYAVKMNANGTLYVEFAQANTWLPANNSLEGYVPQLTASNEAISSNLNDYVLMFTSSDAETITPTWKRLPDNAFENDNTTYKLKVNNSTKGDSTNGVDLGTIYAPTSAGTGFLKGTAGLNGAITWSWDNSTYNNYELPTASSSTLGGVKVGDTLTSITGYTAVKIKDDIIYYKDTTYTFSNLSFKLTSSGLALMNYNSQAARTILAGNNITFEHNNNILTIKATDTWIKFVGATDSSNGTAGYIDAPGKTNKNNFLRGDGTWQSLESNVTSALYVGASNGTSTAAQSTNGSVYLIFKEGSSYSRYQITGSGRASVTSDGSGNITINSSGYSNFTAATASVAGSAGLVPGPGANQLGSSGYYLKANGTWDIPTNTWKEVSTSQEGYVPKIVTTGSLTSSDNPFILVYKNVSGTTKSVWVPLPTNAFNDTWTAADFTNAGYVPKSVKGKFLHAKSDTGALEWVDDNNTWDAASTSKAGYVPKLATGGGTIASSDTAYVLAYKSGVAGTTTPVWIQLPSNAYNNTWTAMTGATASANGTVGYVNATPPKDGYNTKFLRADGTWSIPAYPTKSSWNYDDRYLSLSSGGTVSGNITANSFIKADSSDSYALLGGGGSIALSELKADYLGNFGGLWHHLLMDNTSSDKGYKWLLVARFENQNAGIYTAAKVIGYFYKHNANWELGLTYELPFLVVVNFTESRASFYTHTAISSDNLRLIQINSRCYELQVREGAHTDFDIFYLVVNAGNGVTYYEGNRSNFIQGSDGTVVERTLLATYGNYAHRADVWATDRTLTIGNKGKTVNGSADVSWTLTEIGIPSWAQANSKPSYAFSEITGTVAKNLVAALDYLPISGGTISGTSNKTPLVIKGGTSGYRHNIQLIPSSSWSGILFGANDVTAEVSNTTTNSYWVGNNNGLFSIAKNGSGNANISLYCDGTDWYVNKNKIIHAGNISSQSVSSAVTATNLSANPTLLAGTTNTNAITVTAGGKTSSEFIVPYATNAGTLGGVALSSIWACSLSKYWDVAIANTNNWFLIGTFGSGSGYGRINIHVGGLGTAMNNTISILLTNVGGWSYSRIILCGETTNSTSLTKVAFYNNAGTGTKVYLYLANTYSESYKYTGYRITVGYSGYFTPAGNSLSPESGVPASSSNGYEIVSLTYGHNIIANLLGSATYASSAGSVPWSGVSSTPTTLSGYGITDNHSVSFSSDKLIVKNVSNTLIYNDYIPYSSNSGKLNSYTLSELFLKSGENLIKGSTYASTVGWSQTGWSGSISTENAENGIYNFQATNGWWSMYYALPSEYGNTEITYSFDAKIDSSRTTNPTRTITVGKKNNHEAVHDITSKVPVDSWAHITGTYTTNATPYFSIVIWGTDGSSKTVWMNVRNLKVEVGKIQSCWTPSPSDISKIDWSRLLNAPTTKNLNINGTNYALYTSASSLPSNLKVPTSYGAANLILATNSSANGFTWIDKPVSNVSSALYVGGSGDISSNSAQTTNGNVYLTLKEGSTYYKHNIVGSGRTTVKSDANGKITIDTPTYTVNNGNLYLLANSTTVKTFTANQSGDTTLDIKEGSSNGTISVGGADVGVKGLSALAYYSSSDVYNENYLATWKVYDVGNTGSSLGNKWYRLARFENTNPGNYVASKIHGYLYTHNGNHANGQTYKIPFMAIVHFTSDTGNFYYSVLGNASKIRFVKITTRTYELLVQETNDQAYTVFYLVIRGSNGVTTYEANTTLGTSVSDSQIITPQLLESYGNYAYKASKWASSRSFTIGNKSNNVNGTSDVSWTLTEIGIPTWAQASTKPSYSWDDITSKPLSATSGNNGPTWGNFVPVKSDGVMEIGKYLDFHNSSNDGVDYAVRLTCQGNNQVIVNLPTSAGTLALTSQLPTVNNGNLYLLASGTTKTTFTANQSGNSTFNIATGSSNGTISVGGADVAVKGLGTNAYIDIPHISGENLIKGSSWASTTGWSLSGWGGGISTHDATAGIYNMWSTNGWRSLYYTLPSEYASKVVSYSFDVYRVSANCTEQADYYAIGSTNSLAGSNDFKSKVVNNQWVHIYGKLTLGSTPYFTISIRGTDSSGKTDYLRIRNLKVNLGEPYTIWTPSPYDITQHTHTWDSITSKPSSFTPSSHTHPFSQITDGTSSSTASGWSHILSNTYGGSLKSILYMCHGGGYGMHLRGYSTSASVYMLEIYNTSSQVFAVYGDGHAVHGGTVTATHFYEPSDMRLKHNISMISKSIRKFKYNSDDKLCYGFIAQELETLHPELVDNSGEYKTVNYNSAICYYIAELENRILKLEDKLKKYEEV